MAAVLVLEAPPDDAFHAPAREPLVQRPLHQHIYAAWRRAPFLNAVQHMLARSALSTRYFALVCWSRRGALFRSPRVEGKIVGTSIAAKRAVRRNTPRMRPAGSMRGTKLAANKTLAIKSRGSRSWSYAVSITVRVPGPARGGVSAIHVLSAGIHAAPPTPGASVTRRRSSSRPSTHAGPRAAPSCAASLRRC